MTAATHLSNTQEAHMTYFVLKKISSQSFCPLVIAVLSHISLFGIKRHRYFAVIILNAAKNPS